MSKRISVIVLALMAFALSLAGIQKATSQQDDERKQTLVIGYPNSGILIDGKGSTPYRGMLYVKIFPVSPNIVKKYGAGPIASAELAASQREVCQLPLGEYEVRYSLRNNGELKTFILRDVILRADRAVSLTVEMNNEAKTTIVGGDMTAQQMADSIRQLQREIGDLRQEVTRLKQK